MIEAQSTDQPRLSCGDPEKVRIARRSRHQQVDPSKVRAGTARRSDVELPRASPFLLRGFNWYVPRYLRRNFNAVRVAKHTTPRPPESEAIICFANHPGWWDPLTAFLLHQHLFPGRTLHAPIAKHALAKYPIFKRLGFYGVDLDSMGGAKQFLAVTRELLRRPTTAIWITPGGKFADVRQRTRFEPGLSHLAATACQVTLIPIAIEYSFWEERTPEALIEFGSQICTEDHRWEKTQWQSFLEDELAAVQESLARKVTSRDSASFDVVLEGQAGVGGGYDVFRRIKSLMSWRAFDPRHRHRDDAEEASR